MHASMTSSEKALVVRSWCASHRSLVMHVRFLYEEKVRDVEHQHFSFHPGSNLEKLTLKANGSDLETLDFGFWEVYLSDACDELILVACGGRLPTLRGYRYLLGA